MQGGFDSCRFDFRIDTKNGLTPSRRKKIERRTGYNTLFKCKTCGSLFDSRPALLTHKLTHNPVNEWTCPVCECKSAGKMTLEQHLRKTHCIGSVPTKKGSQKGGKNQQFALTAEEIQIMVKNSEQQQAQMNNLKIYEDEIITTQGSPPRETSPSTKPEPVVEPPEPPKTTATTIIPSAPKGMVCVNVPIYIGPQGARPQFIPQPAPPGMIHVLPHPQGGQFVSAMPQVSQAALIPTEPGLAPNMVKLERNQENLMSNSSTSHFVKIQPAITVKQESMNQPQQRDLIEANVSFSAYTQNTQQSMVNLTNATGSIVPIESVPQSLTPETLKRKSPSLEGSEFDSNSEEITRENKNSERDEYTGSPRLKKPKLGCINMTVEKLWQNRKKTSGCNSPESVQSSTSSAQNAKVESQDINSKTSTAPSVKLVEPIVIEPQSSTAEQEISYTQDDIDDNEFYIPKSDPDPNLIPSDIHLEIKEQYIQYAKGRKRRMKDPYCTAMFHTCRICKQLFDTSEKMWAHMLTHEEMYRKPSNLYQCTSCEFSTESEDSIKQHQAIHQSLVSQEKNEQEAPLNLSVRRESVQDINVNQVQKGSFLTGSRLFRPDAVMVDFSGNSNVAIASGSTSVPSEPDNMWECDFCDYISTESYLVVKQHMADVHGYYMDVISHKPQNQALFTAPPVEHNEYETGGEAETTPSQIEEQGDDQLIDIADLISPDSIYNTGKKEVEKSSDMQEESGFFHYSKKQWRHLTQNQSNISIQDAVQSDAPMETTFHMCKICKKLFNTIWDKWEHNYLVHRESHCKLHCPWCNFISFSRKKLHKHVESAHPDVNDSEAASDGKPHVCEICGNTYISTVHYKLHLLKHGEEGPPVFQCPYDSCQMKYHTKSGLRNHMKRVHLDNGTDEMQTCPYQGCGKQFSASGMKRHLVCHSEDRPVLCKYPGCGQSFREVKHLRVHWLQHTDEKPMRCEICDYSCRQRSSMNWHMKSRHGLTKTTGADGKTTYA